MDPKALAASALIVVDMQRYFLERGAQAYLRPPRDLVPNVLGLVSAFRGAGRPVAFTRHAHLKKDPAGQMGRWWGGKLPRLGDPQSELIEDLAPARGEPVIVKQRYSALERTRLEAWLRKRRVDTLVICGVMTNLCVETTARHAFMREFQPVVVGDACAAGSAEFQSASLANLAYGFALIATAREVISSMRRRP
ncbi:MAG: cysteine hydrolase [Proteobacteria bacterium]|nr:cysteine hydrolase [Pseudomonadota bacterium]